jgi:hypothetical protein
MDLKEKYRSIVAAIVRFLVAVNEKRVEISPWVLVKGIYSKQLLPLHWLSAEAMRLAFQGALLFPRVWDMVIVVVMIKLPFTLTLTLHISHFVYYTYTYMCLYFC